MKKTILLLIAAILAVNLTNAQAPDPDTTARHFLIKASIGNLHEVSAGKLAEQKMIPADVKSFGQMMVMDHGDAEKKLLQVASSANIQLPAPAIETPQTDPNLAKASGDEFIRLYVHSMASGHRSTVTMFQDYAVTCKNPKVRAFAQQMLPTLKQHLEAIKALDDKYKFLAAK